MPIALDWNKKKEWWIEREIVLKSNWNIINFVSVSLTFNSCIVAVVFIENII